MVGNSTKLHETECELRCCVTAIQSAATTSSNGAIELTKRDVLEMLHALYNKKVLAETAKPSRKELLYYGAITSLLINELENQIDELVSVGTVVLEDSVSGLLSGVDAENNTDTSERCNIPEQCTAGVHGILGCDGVDDVEAFEEAIRESILVEQKEQE